MISPHTKTPQKRITASYWYWPQGMVLSVSLAGAVFLFALDAISGFSLHLETAYLLPLALIATRSERHSWKLVWLLIATFQALSYLLGTYHGVWTWVGAAMVAAGDVAIVVLSRSWRAHYLTTREQAVTDPLTSLFNRRSFTLRLEEEIARQRRYGGSLAVASIDLDGFKRLNDAMGHGAGDRALVLVAHALRSRTRNTDVVCRLGGDEFAILLTTIPVENCQLVLDKILNTLVETMRDAGLQLTASIGCQVFLSPPASSAEALDQADKVMYQAKRSGKNRVLCETLA